MMKVKIAGIIALLAGTATVFAATHKSLNIEPESSVNGVAGIVKGLDDKWSIEMELVGLQPNTQYIVRLENTACQNLPDKPSASPGRLFVATYIESNQFGTLSTLFEGLPEYAKNAHSVALYSESNNQDNVQLKNVHCLNLG